MPTRARVRPPSLGRVVWDGQSLNWIPFPPNNVPTRTMLQLPGVPWQIIAVGAWGFERLMVERDPQILAGQARGKGASILVMNGGQGDVLKDGVWGNHTAEDAYAIAGDFATLARSVGYDVIVGVVMPAIGEWEDRLDDGRGQAVIDYQDLCRSDPDGIFDAIADCSVAPLDDPTDLTYFLPDRIHLEVAGAQAMADIIAPVLAPYVTPPRFEDFTYTGAAQTFTVPAGVTSITVTLDGGQGGPNGGNNGTGGLGARVVTTLAVTPSETLGVDVGGAGGWPTGGWPGGGDSRSDTATARRGGSGGGYSAIRRGAGLADRLAVAGGGGGAGYGAGVNGGDGGENGAAGVNGQSAVGGTGGTQSAGGTGGGGESYHGGAGALAVGGSTTADGGATTYRGGAGGGGFYGGGAGASGNSNRTMSGGGGGSSMSTGTATTITDGHHTGNGHVRIEWG